MCLFTEVKHLYDNELYSNLIILGSMVLTISDNVSEAILAPAAKYQTIVYMAKSLQCQGEYKRADSVYKKALQYQKAILKTKVYKGSEIFKDTTSECDVKYAMAQCNIAVKQYSQALGILESVLQKHRDAKINMMLGRLYHQSGMERPAIMAYKEVIKECPLALQAIQELLSLGVSGAEIASAMMGIPNNTPTTEWISQLVKGYSYLYSQDYPGSISVFKQLEDTSLHRDAQILTLLGEAYYFSGDYRNALSALQKAHSLDPLNLKGMDMLACLLAGEKKIRDLENLAMDTSSITETAPEPWITMGYYCQATKHRLTKAIHFAHKACSINPRSVQGLLLKGSLLLELKKLQEATLHFREAMQIAPHRFEPHKGLIDCYIAMHRSRDAYTIASNACKVLGQNPRTLTLCASVLLKDSMTVAKGKSLLEKALKEDPYHLPAVYLICDIYVQDMRYDAAIELLRKQVSVQPSYRLHQMLADFLNHIQDEEEAAHHFSIALNLSHEPTNPRSLDELSKVDTSSEVLEFPPYDMEVEDGAESEVLYI